MPSRGKPSLSTLATIVVLLMSAGGFAAWRFRMVALEQDIEHKRTALKSLHVIGKIPPTHEVMRYLTNRTTALEAQYHSGLKLATQTSGAVEGHADIQLYFQQRVHEVQRTLERLTSARGMTMPTQLGFPKELPPTDAVPRLLLQLGLIEDASELAVAQGITQLMSVKVEDPQAVAPIGENNKDVFLTRLPVRLRLSCSLDTLTKVLGVLNRAKPMMDLQVLRLKALPDGQALEVELVLTRYLVAAPELEPASSEEDTPKESPAAKPKRAS